MDICEFEEFLSEIEHCIEHIMDGYYGGMEVDIIDKLRNKFKSLVVEND